MSDPYILSLLPPDFRAGIARSAPRFIKCAKHGEVETVDANGVVTDGPDGVCPHCQEEERDGLHFNCPEHGSQVKDAQTGKCPVCALAGDPDGVEASRCHYADREVREVAAEDIWPDSIFAKPGERAGSDAPASDPQGAPLVADVHGEPRLDDARADRAGDGAPQRVPAPSAPRNTGGLELSDDQIRDRIASLRARVASGEAPDEELFTLHGYLAAARQRGIL